MKRTEIEPLLPRNFQRTVAPGAPLHALLDLMEQLHAPSEEALANLDVYFDARRAPDRFVPYLARWMDLEPLLGEGPRHEGLGSGFAPGVGRLRSLVTLAAFFWKWRGTKRCLQRFLEVATGYSGFVLDEQPAGKTFHVALVAPKATEPYRDLIERIMELEKPAYVTYDLTFE